MGKETLETLLDENLSEQERLEKIKIEEMKLILNKFPEFAREMML